MLLSPRAVLVVAYGLALCVPLVPVLLHRLSPPPVLRSPETPADLAFSLLEVAGAAGHGARGALLALACAVLACLATVAAGWLWHRGPDASTAPAAAGLWAPLPLALLGLGLSFLIGDALATRSP